MRTLPAPANFTASELRAVVSKCESISNITLWMVRSVGELTQSIDAMFETLPGIQDAWRHTQSALVFEMERLELYHQQTEEVKKMYASLLGNQE